MSSLPVEIYAVSTVREIDRTAIEDHGVPGYSLMTRAGEAAFHEALLEFPGARRWLVVCGAGNNAGDGYVVARLAAAAGLDVTVIALVDPARLGGDAALAYADFEAAGGEWTRFDGGLDADAELIVDALLGSGLDRELSGDFAAAVAAINDHPASVLALDIPSGLNGDSGEVQGAAVKADLTVTFVGLKSGLFVNQGPEFCGEVRFAGLEIPEAWRPLSAARFRRMDADRIRQTLPRRPRAAHKGNFGHVLVIGGGAGMPGAARLCGEAALRTGAGLVSVATDPGHAALITATRPELMAHALAAPADLEPLLDRADVIAFGPGLGRSAWAEALFARLAGDARPAVWDADALYWLAVEGGAAEQRIITPHPGEAAALLGRTASAVQQDRPAALEALEDEFGGVAVLKGAGSLVSSRTGAPWLSTSGNPGMAAAGMGDVLTGIIAALLAQGLSLEDAAVVGVTVHARAGDLAAENGERGLLASDLIAELRRVVNP